MASGKTHIAVVGGGAAGLACAVAAARAGADVTVFEAHERVGDSIKATGDGRCNVANSRTAAADYRNAPFVSRVFDACSPQQALEFLGGMGLLVREESEGRLYPQTNKSTTVIDVLRLAAARAGVRECCSAKVDGLLAPEGLRPVQSADGSFAEEGAEAFSGRGSSLWPVRFADGSFALFDRVVLATGGRTFRSLVPREVAFHDFQPLLGPLATETGPLRGLDKVRVKCALACGSHVENGEVTFRPYGISGIAAFNMSRYVRAGDVVSIDFLPGRPHDRSRELLRGRLASLRPATWLDFTCGMLLPLVARAVLRRAGLDPEGRPEEGGLEAFHRYLREFPLTVRGIGDERLCQVHRGGVDVAAVDPATMQLDGCPGLHVAGELVDVDGPCGGYNLHWAWCSGLVAGRAVAR